MKYILILITFLFILFLGSVLYQKSLIQSSYNGLPTVACIDPTKSIVEKFSFNIQIFINGKNYPLSKNIGHDFGNCLHAIFVKDASGKVYINSNKKSVFTLGQFFDVWHETFSKTQIFNFIANDNHKIEVYVNSKLVNTYRNTLLFPNENIKIVYQ